MARVAVVKPVVVVCDIVGIVASHSAERRLAAVPESVVAEGDVFCSAFQVGSAVALGLVGITTCLAVEEVYVVNPNI